ncbi:M48 family metalloprotease [Actinoplanes sp. NPDC049668]|uniref:M48 family metalloprotease n=1 Tax=unclassified Actinoplanes TaxID=2626549 RepID=UPI0033B81CC4
MNCPHCFNAVTAARDATPWCPSCEWNLSHFEPGRRPPELGWVWADRATHRVAWRLTAGQFARLADGPLQRRSWSAARVFTMAMAVFLLIVVVAAAGLGVWLTAFNFPGLTILPGVALLGVAVALRPRLGSVGDDVHLLDRDEAPELWALIDRVAAASGAPVPHLVGLDSSLGAYTTTVGLRRRRVLCLGAPLWSVLDQQERVALVGHELGHFVNGDLRRGPLTQVALSTLGRLAVLTRPDDDSRWTGVIGMIAAVLQWLVQSLLYRLVLGLHLVVVWIGQRDAQRAEYLADEVAARAAGSAAAVRLLDALLLHEAIDTVICREARAKRAGAAWREAADVARANLAPGVPAFRQLSRRDEVSLFASHPPTGLRARMLERRPQHAAAVTLTEQQAERIDTEIAGTVERVRRDLATAHY